MANPEHVEVVMRGAEAIRAWRAAHPDTRLDLSSADLSGVDMADSNLVKANLVNANLSRTSLRSANLSDASLIGADLYDANLSQANLSRANLSEASLIGADLTEARLTGTNLQKASLGGAHFSGAILGGAHLSFIDLSQSTGTSELIHTGPNEIGIHTIIMSKGRIPEVFLRGCGVPEEWITHIPALLSSMQPIRFYSCFISYSHADKPFAQRLYEALQARGIRCWLDAHQLLPGDDVHEQIDRGIRLWDKVLLCVSKASLTSWWVQHEIAAAFEKERLLMKERGEKTLALIPLDLDGFLFSKDCPTAVQAQLKTRIAAKLASWDTDNALFERELERLIKALQTNDTSREPPPPHTL